MQALFHPEMNEDRRAQLIEEHIDVELAEQFSWAIPDARALRIIAEFSPVVEIGCGKGYWGKLLKEMGVEYAGYDIKIPKGAKHISRGGPAMLKRFPKHTLLLCYPDDYQESDESMALKCLNLHTGEYVVHVGELLGETFVDSPYGKTSAPEFQEQLAQDYHCILKVPIPTWPGAMDTLSVWKRTARVDVDELQFRSIPPDEQLTQVAFCPASVHLVAAPQTE
jgi:hypothetical protein